MTGPDDTRFRDAPWRQIAEPELGAARAVPTMLKPEEQRFYLWLTRDWYDGAGAIVDLGCFAGGSTARLAEGLRQGGHNAHVHAFDAFTVSERWKQHYLYPAGIAPFEGEDMLPLAQRLLHPWTDRVTLHAGRIEDQDWPGDPIAVLVLDASKTVRSMDRMAEKFFPHLIPGRSVIVQQDLLHWKQPWIVAQMGLYGDCFRPVAHCPKDTVAYLCTARITAEQTRAARVLPRLDDEIRAAAEDGIRRLSGFGIDRRLRTLLDALDRNPGIRAAWKMQDKPA